MRKLLSDKKEEVPLLAETETQNSVAIDHLREVDLKEGVAEDHQEEVLQGIREVVMVTVRVISHHLWLIKTHMKVKFRLIKDQLLDGINSEIEKHFSLFFKPQKKPL